MRVGVVGANGQVGTELCFRFRASGETVVPVVRNRLGAAVFDRYGFDYRIADFTDAMGDNGMTGGRETGVRGTGRRDVSERVGDALDGLDVVVVAAFAPYFSRNTYRAGGARRANDRLVTGTVRSAPPDATVVYCSSIAAFGSDIGRSGWWWYAREKRRLEDRFTAARRDHDREGYALRLGHVFGPNQNITQEIRSRLDEAPEVTVVADPARPSNAVHTVTVREAIHHCVHEPVPDGTYTLVNAPQWTWGDVIDHYAPADTPVRFEPPASEPPSATSSVASILSRLVALVPLERQQLVSFMPYLPGQIDHVLFDSVRRQRTADKLHAFEGRFDYHRREFEYDPAPGPFLPDFGVPPETVTDEDDAVERVL